jgi:precorrin-3B C17-methyltransferase
MGDFVTVLYNPSSRRRADYLGKACDILIETRSADTVCGWVRNIGREGQEHKIMTLGQLKYEQVDMFTTVFIGNSDTEYTDGYMVTGRGYTKL